MQKKFLVELWAKYSQHVTRTLYAEDTVANPDPLPFFPPMDNIN